jgi:hypothetical protein
MSDLIHPPFVTHIRDADQLPDTFDATEHAVVNVHVFVPPEDDADGRFAIGFVTESGRCLRVRLPDEHLASLGKLLLSLANGRAWRDDVVHEPREVVS